MHEIAETDKADLKLEALDAAEVERLARALCAGGEDQVDAPEWVSRARRSWDELPLALRRQVHDFRRHSGPSGSLVIGGLPVGEADLPATPAVADSVQREASVPQRC